MVWWPSVWYGLGLWHHQDRISAPPWSHLQGRNDLPFLSPLFCLSLYGRAQWSRHDSSKVSLSPHCGCLLKLSHSYQAKGPVYDFGANHNWDCLRIGCSWYDQQWDILIIVLDPWDLEVDLHKPLSFSAIVSCPSIITGALLECPTKQAIGSG